MKLSDDLELNNNGITIEIAFSIDIEESCVSASTADRTFNF